MNEPSPSETPKVRKPSARKIGGAGKRPPKAATDSASSSAAPAAEPTGLAPLPAATAKPKNISLEFFSPQARDIYVAGSFNDWNPQANRLSPQGNGKWTTELALTPGKYEYRLVVDGVWTDDPMSAESAPNPFGGFNSVLRV